MNPFRISGITQTSAAGLLIAIVTVASVLSQQASRWRGRKRHRHHIGERNGHRLLGLLAAIRLTPPTTPTLPAPRQARCLR